MSSIRLGLAAALAVTAASLSGPSSADTPNRPQLQQAVKAAHGANVQRLREWIAYPTIAAEKVNVDGGAEYMRKLLLDAGFQQAKIIPTSGVPGRVRDARRRRSDHARHLFHVRRQAVRPQGMVVAAARGADGRPARGQGDHGPRRGQPEGAGNGLPVGAPGVQGHRPQASRQHRAGRRGRGGDRLSQLPRDRRQPRSPGGDEQGGRGVHSRRWPGIERRDIGQPRRQGRDRDPADLDRRELGPRAGEGHPLEPDGDRRQSRRGGWSRRSTRWWPKTASRRRSRAGSKM